MACDFGGVAMCMVILGVKERVSKTLELGFGMGALGSDDDTWYCLRLLIFAGIFRRNEMQ